MQRMIRLFRLLALALWIGGLVFFAFAVAPVAFGMLPSTHEAGLVVGGTLRVLHLLGLGCGVVFFLLTAALLPRTPSRSAALPELALALVMLAITAWSQFDILPAMEVARAQAGGDVALAAPINPGRVRFDQLHRLSEKLEGAVLLCGLAVLFLLAGERTGVDPHRR